MRNRSGRRPADTAWTRWWAPWRIVVVLIAAMALGAPGLPGLPGLSATPAHAAPVPPGGAHTGGPITRTEVLARAQGWYEHAQQRKPGEPQDQAVVTYNSNKCYLTGIGTIANTWTGPGGCEDSTAPDGPKGYYRADCSGFVSMALMLGHSYAVTVPGGSLAQSALMKPEGKEELKPGDVLIHFDSDTNKRHTRLFDMWVDGNHSEYWAYDFGATPVKHKRYAWSDGYFAPYRYLKIVDDDTTHFLPEGATVPPGVNYLTVKYYKPWAEDGAATFTTWGDALNVRAQANTSSGVVGTIAGGSNVRISCQVHGQSVTAEGTTNDAWSYLPDYGGWITNIYLQGPAWMPGVNTCAAGGGGNGASFMTWGDALNVRGQANTSGGVVATIAGGTSVRVSCQVHGQSVTAEGTTNDAWSYLPDYGGWITNIYLQGPAWMPGVDTCLIV
ncbi:hypothetical protein [Streptomyces sp. NPDC060031]|uniref:hypothetical protein n=1 Tax=Streptomyces sp. NPDC060031 TaxID=3347043 RepID=UPI0036BBD2E0